MQSNLKSSLAAVHIDEVVGERLYFDCRRNLTRLTERADASGLVAGDSFPSSGFVISADFPPKLATSFFIDNQIPLRIEGISLKLQ